jgi:hypothetical protein
VNFLKNHAIANNLVMTKQTLTSALNFACNHEILRRKTFWVDDSLVFMLSQTTFDPQQVDLKLPFAAFALVFTDRKFLSLAESMLSKERDDLGAKSPLCGFILQCATIYINEKQVDSKRVIELGMAFDTLGADLPDIVEHTLVVEDFKITGLPSEKMIKVKELDGTMSEMPQISLRGQLLHLVLNAVMYSTSAEIDIIEIEGAAKKSNQDSSPKRPLPTPDPVVTSDRVFYLPGKIDIIEVRKMKRLERAPQGGKLLYRFMVRGHWRRPAKSWADKRPRWIQPFWKGPDLAAVIERSYRLRSD